MSLSMRLAHVRNIKDGALRGIRNTVSAVWYPSMTTVATRARYTHSSTILQQQQPLSPQKQQDEYMGRSIMATSALRRMVSVLRIDSTGRITPLQLPITQLKDESRLHMRELLVVEQPAMVLQPRILPRRHCIVLTMGYIRAIVWTDRVYLFNTSHKQVQQYTKNLANHIHNVYNMVQPAATKPAAAPAAVEEPLSIDGERMDEPFGPVYDNMMGDSDVSTHEMSDSEPNNADVSTEAVTETIAIDPLAAEGGPTSDTKDEIAPFEMIVLEHVLLTSEARQAKRVAYSRRVLESILSKIETVERDDGSLYTLFPLANTLTHYEMISRGLMECIRALLDDDRDMREACLTEKMRLSEQLTRSAALHAQSQAAAFDPTVGSSGGDTILPAELRAKGISRMSKFQLEGNDAFLGYVSSPISSHRHVARVLKSNDSFQEGVGIEPLYNTDSSESNSYILTENYNGQAAAISPMNSGLRPSAFDLEDAGPLRQSMAASQVSAAPKSHSASYAHANSVEEDAADFGYSDRMPPILRVPSDALSHLELMLESVYHRSAETTMNVQELFKSLKNKQDLLELQQSNYRNFILSVSLRMSIVSVAVSLGMFVTSSFGMNLLNGVEQSVYAFPAVSIGSAGLSIYVYRWLGRATLSSSPTRKYSRRLNAFQDFLYKLDTKMDAAKDTIVAAHEFRDHTDEGLRGFDRAVSWHSSKKDSGTMQLSKPEFKSIYKRSIGRDIEDEELDLLFDVLDANGDGKLQLQEVVGMFQRKEGGAGFETMPFEPRTPNKTTKP